MKINVLNINNFYTHMTIISTIKDYQWIFDIFKQENKQFHSSIYEYITSVLGIEPNAATDLMIDLDKIAAKDDAVRFLGLLKYKNKDLFYTRVRDYFISEKLGEKFGFSDEVKAQVLVHLKKSHTWDIEDDEDKKTNQIAFEIAEKYNRPAHAESKNINELDKFLLNGK